MSKNIMGIIESAYKQSSDFNFFLENYLTIFKDILSQLSTIDCNPLVEKILECHKRGKKIIILGNGGSAANATHISTGLSYITRNWDNPIKSLSLGNDSILMSSLANDFSHEEIFYRQLQVHLEEGDMILALSVSGTSKNVLRALRYAKTKNVIVFGLTGSDAGELPSLVDYLLHVKNSECLYGVTEDVHMVLGHALTYYLENYFKNISQK